MLVAKLDYLQLLAVKGVLGWLGRQATRRIPPLRPPRPPPADDADGAAAPGGRRARPDGTAVGFIAASTPLQQCLESAMQPSKANLAPGRLEDS